MAEIKPFKIAVPDQALRLLQQKLDLASFPEETAFTDNTQYGASLSQVRRLVSYWRDGYDWRKQEAELNRLPQYTTKVTVDGFDDLEIHFIHQPSERPGSIPLLFCHGWPGSFLEVLKILPLLTKPENGPSFHVVAPSLPNYGFSDLVRNTGFGIRQYAEALHKVMIRLGYEKYATQGGDWGFFITRSISDQYPAHCIAAHVNMLMISPQVKNAAWFGMQYMLNWFTPAEKEGLARTRWYWTEGSGYMAEQSTKPSTVGFAMADSPVALLSWIYEKLIDWTDDYNWRDDEILTWVSIYQFSKAGPAASMRIYYEARHSEVEHTAKALKYIPNVPLGVSCFPMDISPLPLSWCKVLGPIAFQARHERGGHFAAHEQPEQLVQDLRTMFGKGGGAELAAAQFMPPRIN